MDGVPMPRQIHFGPDVPTRRRDDDGQDQALLVLSDQHSGCPGGG